MAHHFLFSKPFGRYLWTLRYMSPSIHGVVTRRKEWPSVKQWSASLSNFHASTFWPHLIHDNIYICSFLNMYHTHTHYYGYYIISCRVVIVILKYDLQFVGRPPRILVKETVTLWMMVLHRWFIPKADHLSCLHCRLVARHGAMPSHPDVVVSLGLVLMNLAFAVSWRKKKGSSASGVVKGHDFNRYDIYIHMYIHIRTWYMYVSIYKYMSHSIYICLYF